ncbi:MAG TPA: hypothetical protein VFW44_11665 [Bryobacteraceae bacterium]|nr:hypothetical protein [Bryobacteraceae bacterium]
MNAASYAPAGLPGGAIAQGSIFTIFGSGLGPSAGAQVSIFPLQTTFQGVSVRVSHGSTSVDGIPIYVQAGQLNVILPSNTPLGRNSVVVTYNGSASNLGPITVVASNPGIFSVGGAGSGTGVVQNFVSQASQPVNSIQAPATQGQTEILYATGLGAGLNADNSPPQAGNLPVSVDVFVGGIAVKPTYAGRSPCCSGLDQIVFQIPANAPSGCWVPVQLRTASTNVSNAATIAISNGKSACPTTGNALGDEVLRGGNVALVALERHNSVDDVDFTTAQNFSADYASMVVGNLSGGAFAFNNLASLPPLGSCTFYQQKGLFVAADNRPLLLSVLSGGTPNMAVPNLNVSNGSATISAFSTAPGVAFGLLGRSDDSSDPLFLNGTEFTVTETGSFTVTVPQGSTLTWKNRDQIGSISRGGALPLSWSASGKGTVLIFGGNYDRPTNSSGVFLCAADAAAGSLTIPSYILQGLPPTRSAYQQSEGHLQMAVLPASLTSFSAAGIDSGLAATLVWAGKTVQFQ